MSLTLTNEQLQDYLIVEIFKIIPEHFRTTTNLQAMELAVNTYRHMKKIQKEGPLNE